MAFFAKIKKHFRTLRFLIKKNVLNHISKKIEHQLSIDRQISSDVTCLHQPENGPCFGVKKPTTLAGSTQFMLCIQFLKK